MRKRADLAMLHEAIQYAFGWDDEHLHEFEIRASKYGVRHEDDGLGFTRTVRSEDKAALRNLVQPGERFTYTYDFGDNWVHQITVEKAVDIEQGATYPRCIGGERACPPEDCGGVWGYANILDAIADPNRGGREELLEWVGNEFDPDYIDLTMTNEALARFVARSGG